MNDLVPMDIDEIHKLKGIERTIALWNHEKWLEKQRKQDKKELRTQEHRIYELRRMRKDGRE